MSVVLQHFTYHLETALLHGCGCCAAIIVGYGAQTMDDSFRNPGVHCCLILTSVSYFRLRDNIVNAGLQFGDRHHHVTFCSSTFPLAAQVI
jgi:hypothetical protein